MSKTKEELNAIKKELETLNEKCRELTPEELKEVTGGVNIELRGDTVSVAAGYQTVMTEKAAKIR